MTNKELIELCCSNGIAAAYGQLGAHKILDLLGQQKKAEVTLFNNNHELQFSEKFIHEHWMQHRNSSNMSGNITSNTSINLHGISFTYPIAFCKFHLRYDKVQQDEVGIFHGIPWHCSSVVMCGRDASLNEYNILTRNDEKETKEMVRNAIDKLKGCNTIFVWGLEQANYLNQFIGDEVKVADMQTYTTGYFFQEVSAQRKQLYVNSALSWGQEKKKKAPSKQALFNEVFDDSLLDYIYAELQNGELADADKIAEQLSAYCAMDTDAMQKLFKIWTK
jgi:hypothetical protein